MISGIGVDIAQISRFDSHDERFYSKILSAHEMERPVSAEYAASRFAAKEAFSKALGTGIRGFSMTEISVMEDENGKPYFCFEGKAAEVASGKRFFLSISHDGGMAVAMVVAEYEE